MNRQALVAPGSAANLRKHSRCRSMAAEAAFRQRLTEMGALLLEADYLGSHKPHRVRCPAGHVCYPRPHDMQRGRGICRTCTGCDPVVAEKQFRERLAELGATPLFEVYQGVLSPHHVRCSAGHDSWPTPVNARKEKGICRTCAGNDPVLAEAAFLAALNAMGAMPLFDTYQGANRPHLVRCPKGHDCYPRPNQVTRGVGICRFCAGKQWDAFYVVTSPEEVKFGITSGDPNPRLADHARTGHCEVIRAFTDLPGTMAPDTEAAVMAALKLAGERPVRGKEYFDISCLALVLDVADSFTHLEDAA